MTIKKTLFKPLLKPSEEVTSKIVWQMNYNATTHVWFPFLLPDAFVQEILNTCLQPESSKYFDAVDRPEKWRKNNRAFYMRHNPWYIAKLTLQYPTDETFRLLEKLENDYSDFHAWSKKIVWNQRKKKNYIQTKRIQNVRITRVDIAKDLICASEYDADDVILFMNSHLIKKYPGKQQIHVNKGNTRYSGQTSASNKIATYTKLDCPVHDEPCAHIEWRATDHDAVERLGIHSVGNLIDFNCREIWETRFVLRCIDEKTKIRIGKIIRDETSACRNSYHEYTCNGHVLPKFNIYLKYGNQFTRAGFKSIDKRSADRKGRYVYLDTQFVMNLLRKKYKKRVGGNINYYFPEIDGTVFL